MESCGLLEASERINFQSFQECELQQECQILTTLQPRIHYFVQFVIFAFLVQISFRECVCVQLEVLGLKKI